MAPLFILLVNIVGCTHGNVRNGTVVWMIDEEDVVLYRILEDEQEIVIPIKMNDDMQNFMCLDKDDVKFYSEEEHE